MSAARRAGRPLGGDRGTAKQDQRTDILGDADDARKQRDAAIRCTAGALSDEWDDEGRASATDALLQALPPGAARELAERLQAHQSKREAAALERTYWPLRPVVEFLATLELEADSGPRVVGNRRGATEFFPPELGQRGVRVLVSAETSQDQAAAVLQQVAKWLSGLSAEEWARLCEHARNPQSLDDDIPF